MALHNMGFASLVIQNSKLEKILGVCFEAIKFNWWDELVNSIKIQF